MSLVESCPSTEMRSNERLTHTPSSRSAVSGASAASVWTKQSIVANAGEIIPAPLACALSRTVPGRQRDLERRVLRELVGGADRLAERVVAVRRSSARAWQDPADHLVGVERHADHAGRGDRHLVLGHAAAIAAAPCMRAASSSPRRPVAALALPELATTARMRVEPAALLREQHRRGEHAGAGEARGADRLRRVGDQQPEVEPAGRLEPARHARGAEAGGQPAVELGHVVRQRRPSAMRSVTAPPLSSRPNIRLRFCTACDDVPFHRLSIVAKTITRPVRVVVVHARCGRSWSRAPRCMPGGPSTHLDQRLARVGVVVERARSSVRRASGVT